MKINWMMRGINFLKQKLSNKCVAATNQLKDLSNECGMPSCENTSISKNAANNTKTTPRKTRLIKIKKKKEYRVYQQNTNASYGNPSQNH